MSTDAVNFSIQVFFVVVFVDIVLHLFLFGKCLGVGLLGCVVSKLYKELPNSFFFSELLCLSASLVASHPCWQLVLSGTFSPIIRSIILIFFRKTLRFYLDLQTSLQWGCEGAPDSTVCFLERVLGVPGGFFIGSM